jgi:hypothetical protein
MAEACYQQLLLLQVKASLAAYIAAFVSQIGGGPSCTYITAVWILTPHAGLLVVDMMY